MNQYLDDKDNKWHLTMSIGIPRLLIKNKLNFRLYSIVMKDGTIIRDPNLNSSKYVFSIAPSFMGKTVFFNTYFDLNEIEKIEEFKFGLCDERIKWYENTIISIKNNYIKSENTLLVEDLEIKKQVNMEKESELNLINISNSENIIDVVSDENTIFNISQDINKENPIKEDMSEEEFSKIILEKIKPEANKISTSKRSSKKKNK